MNSADHYRNVPPVPSSRPDCTHCNDTTRVIIGVYDFGDPVDCPCVCYPRVAKENPRG
jgi:hypothetical protein